MIVGRRIVRFDTVASTMDEAAALAEAGEPEGTAVVAEEQTAGRGRADREWHSPRGAGILCSVVLRPLVDPRRLGALPLLAGVAVAESIEATAGLACQLKWPNDVWIDGRKVAGILTTARSGHAGLEYVVVGVGINVNIRPEELPPGATSLMATTGRTLDQSVIQATLLERLDEGYRAFAGGAAAAGLAAWRRRAVLVGEVVAVGVERRCRVGTMRGVADDGALLLEGADGSLERIYAGDVVRGPVAAGTR
jgi:BirA family biotin operon repressor/biotin-[acetyl-CoA-carboxylase] ligase